ncbi:uncharacterized protein PgNI_08845 [Pyricularia grisea]|uniref:Uncharacterized protein n=1 Tax=Pyricularia grisea TaxID=148305 RepID=A0A6P8AUE2_PYRGI|nr:uncharacterized protein PgNI_08845 [Pyricularia grisea]TLD05843.1 hypothetical protein PgNI_08845 [Pyricularia grisea]
MPVEEVAGTTKPTRGGTDAGIQVLQNNAHFHSAWEHPGRFVGHKGLQRRLKEEPRPEDLLTPKPDGELPYQYAWDVDSFEKARPGQIRAYGGESHQLPR